jgi:hypothetical protein
MSNDQRSPSFKIERDFLDGFLQDSHTRWCFGHGNQTGLAIIVPCRTVAILRFHLFSS